MPSQFENLARFVWPLGLVILAALAGWIFKRIVHRRLKSIAARTRWRGDDVILGAVEGPSMWWFILGGVYLSMSYLPLESSLVAPIQKVVVVLFILTLTFAFAGVVVGLLQLYADSTEGAFPSTFMFTNLIRILVITIGLLMIFQTLGISITPLLTALGVGGLAVSLALKDTLSDLFAGLHILLSRKLKPGDFVELDTGEKGYVENIAWRNTTVKDRLNNLIIVPNSKLSSAIMTNYDVPAKELLVRVECGVSYDSDLDRVEEVALEVARDVMNTVQGGVPDSEPRMRFRSFGDSSINFRVSLWATDYQGRMRVKHEFIKRIHRRFKEEGITIPYPIRTIYQGDLKKT
ncbi:MAG: mechanosensitive ion channel family protein [Fidelibacterota bacterium]